MISEQCCLLDCKCFAVRSQPAHWVLHVAGISFRVAGVSGPSKGAIFTAHVLRVGDQTVVQRLHPLSSLAIDSISCLNSHCEVLEKSIASSQAPEPNVLSWRILLAWWWSDEKWNIWIDPFRKGSMNSRTVDSNRFTVLINSNTTIF